MTFQGIDKVKEASGERDANELMAKGWVLLAVVQGTVPNASSHVKYVQGKPAGDKQSEGFFD